MSHGKNDEEVDFYSLFVPLTTKKVFIFLSVIGFVVFFNALFGQFNWDDISYIQYNPDTYSFNVFKLFQENFFNSGSQYRALTAVYFAFLHTLFGNNPFYYHFIQLGLHILSSCLLYVLFKKFYSVLTSFFLAVLFLIHPIQVESVSFIGASGNILFFLLGILPILLFQNEKYRQRALFVVSGFFLLLLSMLAKETGVVFLMLTFASPFIFKWKGKVKFVVSGIITLALYCLIRFGIGGISLTSNVKNILPIANISFIERVSNIPAIFFYYIKTFLFPYRLIINQVWLISSHDFKQFYFPLFFGVLFLVCMYLIGAKLRKRNKESFSVFIFFLLWFVFSISIHLQIVPLDMTVADRWFYTPLAGLLGIIGVVLQTSNLEKYKKPLIIFAVFILLALSIRTIVRNADWHDYMTLLSHDNALMDNYENENNLATLYSLQRKPYVAMKHAQKSVKIFPYETNLTNLAFINENVGNVDKAEKYYKMAIYTPHKSPNYETKASFAYLRWGGIYLFNGNPQAAVNIYKEAVQQFPNNGVLWSFLAYSYYELGNKEEALASAKKAQRLYPSKSTNKLYNLIQNNQKFDVRKL